MAHLKLLQFCMQHAEAFATNDMMAILATVVVLGRETKNPALLAAAAEVASILQDARTAMVRIPVQQQAAATSPRIHQHLVLLTLCDIVPFASCPTKIACANRRLFWMMRSKWIQVVRQ